MKRYAHQEHISRMVVKRHVLIAQPAVIAKRMVCRPQQIFVLPVIIAQPVQRKQQEDHINPLDPVVVYIIQIVYVRKVFIAHWDQQLRREDHLMWRPVIVPLLMIAIVQLVRHVPPNLVHHLHV
jgi:hypothetical protein